MSFINTFGTTLSYAVLIQGNLVTSCAFIRNKYWTEMPAILDDPDSILWVIVFGVYIHNKDSSDTIGSKKKAKESHNIFIPRVRDYPVHNGSHDSLLLRSDLQQILRRL